ncbi:MAG: VOC family protein [Pseudomonadota bacterium]
MHSWSTVTVGVADLAEAEALWCDTFGMSAVADREAGDATLATLWQLPASAIGRQRLLTTPGQTEGRLHLVEFLDPDPPVREGANTFDLAPKNLDIYVDDLPEKEVELRAGGHRFRTEQHSEVVAPDGTRFRELHMPVHDAINVVLLEVVGSPRPVTRAGFGAVGPLIITVPDARAEQAFARDVLGLGKLSDHVLSGPEIEAMIGLPPGATLDVSIWGDATAPFGQLEIIEYGGTDGVNLYARAQAPATGILQVRYHAESLAPIEARLSDIACERHTDIDLIDGRGALLRFRSPAGLAVEVLAPA